MLVDSEESFQDSGELKVSDESEDATSSTTTPKITPYWVVKNTGHSSAGIISFIIIITVIVMIIIVSSLVAIFC